MPRYKRIRVRGKPRQDIDVDLLAQALITMERDLQQQQKQHENGLFENHEDDEGDAQC